MERIVCPAEYGHFAVGLQEGYDACAVIEVQDMLHALAVVQSEIKAQYQVSMSCNCFESRVVMTGQQEPHLNFHFINYPRFPQATEAFRKHVLQIAQYLMERFKQNRVVVEFPNEFVMLQQNSAVDPRIHEVVS